MNKIEKIARKIVLSSIMIKDETDFINQVEQGELYDDIEYIGKWQGMQAFNVNTNGNDGFYGMHLFISDNVLYYADASLTEDDIQREGENAMPEIDDFRSYKYDEFPFDLNEFKRWLDMRIDNGIEQGSKAWQDSQNFIKADIPDYALTYIVNGDESGLQDDEIKMIDEWMKSENIQSVNPTSVHDEFNASPEFGEPCATTECILIFKD